MSVAPLADWIAGRRAAEARERSELRASGAEPQEAIRQALALIALAARLHGWPPDEDPVSRRENIAARDEWSRLIEALRPR